MPDDTDRLLPADFASPSEYLAWAKSMLQIYAEAADLDIRTAEKLIADGIQLKANALEAIDRADQIAKDLARFLDTSG